MDAGHGSAERAQDIAPAHFDPADALIIGAARAGILERIAGACGRVGRDPAGVQLVAVSKTVAPERLRAAVSIGLDTLGENRVQEAAAKIDEVPGATWHLIGPLQSNKARRAVEQFAMVQTVDTAELAARLDRLALELRSGSPLPVLLQVNVDNDLAKAGFDPSTLEVMLPAILAHPNLDVRGLMTVGRLAGDAALARPTFVALRRLSERLRAKKGELGAELSMGMSDDFEVAIEEGATIVRIGRAIFGTRPRVAD